MCPYCKKLEVEFERLNNVTLYVYPFPLESKFPGSTNIAKSIWCTSDKAKAWEDWMLRALRPSAPTNCSNPFEQISEAAAKLNIDATPTIVFADGGVIRQFANAEAIERFLKDTPVVATAAR
jgi:thiol:disulfide interchange protein DsbC